MKQIFETVILLLTAITTLYVLGFGIAMLRREGKQIGIGGWLFIASVGVPAIFGLGMTLLGYH